MATMDTLKPYEALTAAEMPDRQARALIAIVQELQEARLAEVATKADLRELEARMDSRFATLEIKLADLEGKIDRVKFDLLKWIIPLILGQTAFIVTLLKVLK